MSGPGAHRPNEHFGATVRLRRRSEFDGVLQHGLRQSDAYLTVWAAPNKQGHARLGLIVGRRCGNAMQRNRLKRLLREAFRRNQSRLPQDFDLVCLPRADTALTLPIAVESLCTLSARLRRRWAGRPRHEPPTPRESG